MQILEKLNFFLINNNILLQGCCEGRQQEEDFFILNQGYAGEFIPSYVIESYHDKSAFLPCDDPVL